MTTIIYAILLLCVFLVIAKRLFDINELDNRIDEICAEEKRQNKRIDILEKRELIRQLEQSHDKTYIQSKDLFKDW